MKQLTEIFQWKTTASGMQNPIDSSQIVNTAEPPLARSQRVASPLRAPRRSQMPVTLPRKDEREAGPDTHASLLTLRDGGRLRGVADP